MFNPATLLNNKDFETANDIVRGKGDLWHPALAIRPDGKPYLYRWYLVGHDGSDTPCVMLHIQVASDPQGQLHDHPWDNMSVILAGNYVETIHYHPPSLHPVVVDEKRRRKGDVITRGATAAHRLILPRGVPYCMSLFSTGPKVRDWGFWYGDEWRSHKETVETQDGVSINRGLV